MPYLIIITTLQFLSAWLEGKEDFIEGMPAIFWIVAVSCGVAAVLSRIERTHNAYYQIIRSEIPPLMVYMSRVGMINTAAAGISCSILAWRMHWLSIVAGCFSILMVMLCIRQIEVLSGEIHAIKEMSDENNV